MSKVIYLKSLKHLMEILCQFRNLKIMKIESYDRDPKLLNQIRIYRLKFVAISSNVMSSWCTKRVDFGPYTVFINDI